MYAGTRTSTGDGRVEPGFLLGDGDALLERGRIVRADFAADAVLERRDDLAARGVILRIGGEDQHQIERQPHRVAFDLHVAFLHDVEQAHLNLAGQVGQFVDGEDAAIGARQQAVVHRQLVGNVLPAARRLDGIDIADHVGDGDVRRGQLFHVAMLAVEPGDGRFVARFRNQVAAAPADRTVRVVVNLAALDVGRDLVEQRGQHADEARLGLPAQSQQNEIVARKNGVDHLRHHGILESQNAREKILAALQFADQIIAKFVLDGSAGEARFREGTFTKRAQCAG